MNLIPKEELIPLTPHAFYVLLALAERPMYGYGIAEQCNLDAEGAVTVSTQSIYRTLRNLTNLRLIKPSYQIAGERSPHAKQYFELTDIGQTVLSWECQRYRAAAFLGQHRLAQIPKPSTIEPR